LRVRSPHLWDSAWLSTSDRAKLVEGGTFELLGRKDRIVKIEEKRVSLQAIEASLQGSAYVQEARAVVLEGARTEIAAVIVLSAAGAELLQKSSKLTLNQALRDAASGRVERIGLPRKFRYVDAFPVNQQGKTSETMLRSLFTEGGE